MNQNLRKLYDFIKPAANEFLIKPMLGDSISLGIINYYKLNQEILQLPDIDFAELVISAFDHSILDNEKFLETSFRVFINDAEIDQIAIHNNIDNALTAIQKREKLISLGKGKMKKEIIRILNLEKEYFNPIFQNEYLTRETITPFNPVPVNELNYKDLIGKEYLALHEYQKRIKDRIIQKLIFEPKGKLLVHMPTGSGKTKTAVEAIIDFIRVSLKSDQTGTVIWFAHSKELCEQAYNTFKAMWKFKGDYPINAYKYFGDSDLDDTLKIVDDKMSIIFMGFQKFNPVLNSRIGDKPRPLRQFFHLNTRLVIVDEAHKSLANTYSKAIEFVTEMPNCRLLGLTATPGRSNYIEGDNQNTELSQFFGTDIISITDQNGTKLENPLYYLQNSKPQVLAKINFDFLNFEINLTQEYSAKDIERFSIQEDLDENALNKFAVNPLRNRLIINAITDALAKNESILVFACTTDHCIILQRLLKLYKIHSEVILGTTEKTARSHYIEEFKSNKLKVLINYGVLSTGFDAPNLNTLIIARPTKSIVLYSQIVGRALRGPANGGNELNTIVTIKDNLIGFPNADFMFSYWDAFWN
jgi:superfamily II DNA or RNA helicase